MKKKMKTYCFKCKNQTEMLEPKRSLRNKKLFIGYCLGCGNQVYKTIERGFEKQ
jgi:hypothetical protein